jgi:hypothetical protein
MDSLAKWLIFLGLGIAGLGLLLFLGARIPGLNRLGSLPGDIRYTSPGGNISCFVPIVSMILVSLVLTVLLNVIIRLINR